MKLHPQLPPTGAFTITLGKISLAALVLFFTRTEALPAEPAPAPPPSHGKVFGHGSGLIAADVDFATGRITAVWMAASTGHADLDAAAVKGFRKMRYKPQTVRHVTVPITFKIAGRKL